MAASLQVSAAYDTRASRFVSKKVVIQNLIKG
jgi:hypothetical protein